jgi:hypothetical protein
MIPTSNNTELGIEKTTSAPETTLVDEKKIIDTLFKEKESYQQTTLDARNTINDIYNAYIGKMDNVKKVPYNKKVPYKSNETVPKLRTEISYIVPFIFSGNPEIEIEGEGEEDKPISMVLEKIANYRLDTIPQAYEKIEAWVKQSVTFGTSLLKVNWKFETETQDDGSGQTFQTPVKDEPDLEVPNILDCFYNPIIPDVECQPSIIFRSVIPIEQVKENPVYDFADNAGNLNREKIEQGGNSASNQYDSTRQVQSDSIVLQKASEGTVEVYERVTRDRIQTVVEAKERLVLRDKPWDYGFINAVKLIHEPNCIPNRFDGLGVGQNTMGLGKMYHQAFNQSLESVKLCNNPMFLFKKGAGIDTRQLVSKPGGGIAVDGEGPLANNIQALQFPDIKSGTVELINKIEDEHKRASGANDMMQGSASNKTLGQDQLASTYSSNRFELIQRRFKQALADVANMLIQMELKNLQSPDAAILRIFPAEMRPQIYQLLITEGADVKYNIKVKGDTNIAKNKDIQIKQLIDWYNLFGAILPPENQMEAARKILELRGIDEIDKLVPDLQMFAQQQMMQQQQQQAIDAGMMPQPNQMNMQPQQPQVM